MALRKDIRRAILHIVPKVPARFGLTGQEPGFCRDLGHKKSSRLNAITAMPEIRP